MLLAVEGGRFFSSSASGYSNGLNLLLLGHKKEEKPMRVSPWNQYHLVDQHQESEDPDPQLAAKDHVNKHCVCGCACFGGVESPSIHQHNKAAASDLEKVQETPAPPLPTSDFVDNNTSLKSSLKRRVNNDDGVGIDARNNVQWTDVMGGELVQIREFEPSEHSDSDDDFEHSSGKTYLHCYSTGKTTSNSNSNPTPTPPNPPSSVSSSPPDTKTAVGQNVVTMEFQRQKAKELQEYFKQKKAEAAANQGPFFGWIAKNEISNGRLGHPSTVKDCGRALGPAGMLTEYATGSDFVDQVKILLSNFGIVDLE
ncbi:hypothetical protein OSB04_003585 [Centaurea solstitialis]|uniref:Uncharacterized protein n=1 Tax=Centaurea solstitialis TaxID=347529 RepID=A0AA38WVA1_9ASTR|nr:hypothetical protein OSB04_003585 [Centaurea solstitialis]